MQPFDKGEEGPLLRRLSKQCRETKSRRHHPKTSRDRMKQKDLLAITGISSYRDLTSVAKDRKDYLPSLAYPTGVEGKSSKGKDSSAHRLHLLLAAGIRLFLPSVINNLASRAKIQEDVLYLNRVGPMRPDSLFTLVVMSMVHGVETPSSR